MEILIYKNSTIIVRILLVFSKPLLVCIEKQWIIHSTRISVTHNCSLCLYHFFFHSHTYMSFLSIKMDMKSLFSSTETEEISNLLAKDIYSSNTILILYTVNNHSFRTPILVGISCRLPLFHVV